MSDVKRYDYGYKDDGCGGYRYLGLIEKPYGALVRHSDYAALEAECERLRAQVSALQSDANSWQSGYDKGREDGAKAADGWKAQHARDSAELRRLCAERDALHAEADALRVALLGIASVNPAERGIEWAKSYASDGLNGAGSELYARWLDTFKEAEALRAENGRLQADRDRANQYANQQALECNKLSTDLEAARGLLERVTTSFTIEAYGSALHDARQFLAAALAPEVQASGPYASVAGALAQRYPKPSLLKDCNVSYSNSSRPLAEQGERQEAVAWALANSADEIGGFAPIYYTKEGAISWANGRNIFPLYTTPQPGQDVRGLAAFFIELFDGALDGGSFDGGDIQDAGVRHGLLIVEQREESCGEHCACAEYGFPVDCYRLAPALAAHRQVQRQA